MEECKSSSQRLAILGAVSSKTGSFQYLSKPKFFDKQDMIRFLRILRENTKSRNVAIFCDNCGIHIAKDVIEEAKRLRILIVRNVPYSPWFNGIERIWGRMKWIFRREILRLKMNKERVSLKEIVPNVASKLEREFNLRCALNGWKMLE